MKDFSIRMFSFCALLSLSWQLSASGLGDEKKDVGSSDSPEISRYLEAIVTPHPVCTDLSERAAVILPREVPKSSSIRVPRLLLGDKVASKNPSNFCVTAVVNCAPCSVERHPSIDQYMECNLVDHPIVIDGKTGFDDAARFFESSSKFIRGSLENGHDVLVHCAGGVSRSATIVIAYLIKVEKMTLKDAYLYVQSKRPIIAPNAFFINQLIDLEESVHGRATMERPKSLHQRVYNFIDEK